MATALETGFTVVSPENGSVSLSDSEDNVAVENIAEQAPSEASIVVPMTAPETSEANMGTAVHRDTPATDTDLLSHRDGIWERISAMTQDTRGRIRLSPYATQFLQRGQTPRKRPRLDGDHSALDHSALIEILYATGHRLQLGCTVQRPRICFDDPKQVQRFYRQRRVQQ